MSSTVPSTLPYAHQNKEQFRNSNPQPHHLSPKQKQTPRIINPPASNSQKQQKVQPTFVVQ